MQVYDTHALDAFEIVASYIVDVFYNHLFLTSRDRVKLGHNGASSLTDAYKNSVLNYLLGIKNDNYYAQTVKQLHSYYQKVTVFSTITFGDFQTRILTNFIPIEYFADYSERNKDNTLASIIRRTIQEFGEYVLEPRNLRGIIDDHKNRQNVIMLQDAIVDMLKTQRDEYYVQFAKKINQRSEKVPEELLRKLKEKLVEEVRKRCDLEKDRDKLLNMIDQLIKKIAALEDEIGKLNGRLESSNKTMMDLYSTDRATPDTPAPVETKPRHRSRAVIKAPVEESSDDESTEEDYDVQRKKLAEKIAERHAAKKSDAVDQTVKTESQGIIDDLFDDPGFGLG